MVWRTSPRPARRGNDFLGMCVSELGAAEMAMQLEVFLLEGGAFGFDFGELKFQIAQENPAGFVT